MNFASSRVNLTLNATGRPWRVILLSAQDLEGHYPVRTNVLRRARNEEAIGIGLGGIQVLQRRSGQLHKVLLVRVSQ